MRGIRAERGIIRVLGLKGLWGEVEAGFGVVFLCHRVDYVTKDKTDSVLKDLGH
jgi:hypothetical protein